MLNIVGYRFGRVSNVEVSGFHVRGWNYISTKDPNAYQKFCNKESNVADCFEKIKDGRASGIEDFFEIHDNYFGGKYEVQYNCGASETPLFHEDALGVVCK